MRWSCPPCPMHSQDHHRLLPRAATAQLPLVLLLTSPQQSSYRRTASVTLSNSSCSLPLSEDNSVLCSVGSSLHRSFLPIPVSHSFLLFLISRQLSFSCTCEAQSFSSFQEHFLLPVLLLPLPLLLVLLQPVLLLPVLLLPVLLLLVLLLPVLLLPVLLLTVLLLHVLLLPVMLLPVLLPILWCRCGCCLCLCCCCLCLCCRLCFHLCCCLCCCLCFSVCLC
jgi:hypothetical protein